MQFKLKWWQLLCYETAVISLGIIIGAFWSDFFSDYLYLLIFVFAVFGAYILYLLTQQIGP